MTKIAATDSLVTPTIKAVCDWYGVHPKFAHAVLETFLGVDYERGISEISEFLARYERYRIQLDYTFSTNARGQKLAKQLKEWGGYLGIRPRSPANLIWMLVLLMEGF